MEAILLRDIDLRAHANRPEVYGAAAIAVAFFAVAVVPVWRAARLYCFHTYDLGIYSQAVALWSPRDMNSWISVRQLHIFNDHVDPVLVLATPWTLVMPAWQAALLAETLLVGASIVPVWWLWRRGRLSAVAALVISAMLLLGPATLSALRFPVHPTAWAMLPIALLVAGLLEQRTALMVVALNLLFACKEEFPFAGLALGAALLSRREERRRAIWVLGSSAAWVTVDFVIRPVLLGPTEAYGSSLFAGLGHDPWGYLVARLTAKGAASRIGSILAMLAPFGVLAWTTRRRPAWVVASLLLPMLAIRFLGMSWRFHYAAPVAAVAIMAFVPVLGTHRLPRWLIGATIVLLVTTNVHNLRFAAKMWGLPIDTPPRHCSADPARVEGLDEAVRQLEAAVPGPALVEGNLVPQLVSRPSLYTLGGLQPGSTGPYRYVLVERPPHGDPFPLTRERLDELIQAWRRQADITYRDDDHLFFAAGAFTAARGVPGHATGP